MLQRCNAATLHRCIAAMLRWGGATITPCSTTCNWQPATMSIDSRRGGSYELGIDCKFAPEPFHRTRLVFICPRFVIANEASFPLHYMQARATRRRCSAGSCKEACWWVEVGLGRESSSRRSSPRGDALSASPSSPPPTCPAPSPDVPGGHGAPRPQRPSYRKRRSRSTGRRAGASSSCRSKPRRVATAPSGVAPLASPPERIS